MYLIVLQFLFFNVISISFLIFIGYISKLVYNSEADNLITKCFFSLIIGITLFVFTGSIIITNGVTVNVLLVILFFIFCTENKNNFALSSLNRFNTKDYLLQVIITSIFLIPFFGYECIHFINDNEFNYTIPFLDFSFYADISSSICEFGRENKGRALNMIVPDENSGVTSYHYFELWINGIISDLFRISPLKSLMLITYPILYSLVFMGLLVLINKKLSLKSILIGLLLLCVSPIIISGYNEFELTKYHKGFQHTAILGFGRKYLIIYAFAICSILFFKKKDYLTSILVLLVIPIISIGTAPAIFSSTTLISLLYAYNKKSIKPFLSVLSLLIGILVFYKIFMLKGDKNYYDNFAFYQKIIENPLDLKLYKAFIFTFIFPLIRTLIYYFPFFLIFILFKKKIKYKENRILVLISILLITSGAFFAAVLNGILDSGQVLYNILPLFNLVLIIFLISIAYENLKIFTVLFVTLSIYNFLKYDSFIRSTSLEIYNQHSASFKKKCIKELNKSDKKQIVLCSLDDQFYSRGVFDSYFFRPCFFLGLNKYGSHIVDINIFRMELFKSNFTKIENQYLRELEVNQYIKAKNYGHILPYKVQYKFIEEFNVKYIYLQNNTKIDNRLIDTLDILKTFDDNVTRDKLLVLK